EQVYDGIAEELELLDGAHAGFNLQDVHDGKTTPVFFGSAVSNFGVELLLKGFLEFSTRPLPRSVGEGIIPLEGPTFSAFVFKIQTNMNPQHRDRMVFARICSGRFYRDMTVFNTRYGREVRIAYSHSLFGQGREIANEAYAGDIIGFITNADFQIGDTISSDPALCYNEIPRFAPECFAYVQNKSISSYKSFRKGLDHLLAEDIVQSFVLEDHGSNLPLLGAVGPLQFEVLQYRLRDEYSVETSLEMKQWNVLRWLDDTSDHKASELELPYDCVYGRDDRGRPVLLFTSEWSMEYFLKNNQGVVVHDSPRELEVAK
ncbi:MAG TPA: peptide chain release factor 3, partial [Spirochaetota bacterium]|nr:peptide chain release factor 3 [Spirochaetota bacterium]